MFSATTSIRIPLPSAQTITELFCLSCENPDPTPTKVTPKKGAWIGFGSFFFLVFKAIELRLTVQRSIFFSKTLKTPGSTSWIFNFLPLFFNPSRMQILDFPMWWNLTVFEIKLFRSLSLASENKSNSFWSWAHWR